MILHRCFAWNERARPTEPDGPLWFPRIYQGDGRHDNPDRYGCLYLADREVAAVVEQLSRFRGHRLIDEMLVRRGLRLGLASIELPDRAPMIDLDEPAVLSENDLRPSVVATRQREVTQPQALELYRAHRFAAGLRWWSVYEALWANVTIFDRAARRLTLGAVRRIALDDPAVGDAAALLGLELSA